MFANGSGRNVQSLQRTLDSSENINKSIALQLWINIVESLVIFL